MLHRAIPTLLVVPLFLTLPVKACLNDRDSDTLARQAKKLPDTVRVITGRFERNPPRYYEMRVERVKKQLTANPNQWNLYDDIAVALDRLHRDTEAITWIEKKRSLLPKYDAKKPAVKEAWYRYYANVGTFRAHRWLQNGAKKATRTEMVQARDEIRRAIRIKPDAHFGREKYQLMAMEWILSPKKAKETPLTLANFIETRDQWESAVPVQAPAYKQRKAAGEGLTGLIVLGAAWESVDVFYALAAALDYPEGVTLRHLALLRTQELLKQGKKSLGVWDKEAMSYSLQYGNWTASGIGVNDQNQTSLNNLYPKLRQEADTWAASRALFMNTRLQQGRHPDTDKTFWQGYKPAAAPTLDIPWYNQRQGRYEGESKLRDWKNTIFATAVIVLACAVSLALCKIFYNFQHRPRRTS